MRFPGVPPYEKDKAIRPGMTNRFKKKGYYYSPVEKRAVNRKREHQT